MFGLNLMLTFPAPTEAADNTLTNCPVLKQGMTGPCITILQRDLNLVGFSPALTVDSSFGPLTLKAVKWFQAGHGLSVDGIVGPQTKTTLLQAVDSNNADTKTFTSDSYTLVKYIHTFSTTACVLNLTTNFIPNASELCSFLRNSANDNPPTVFTQESLASFLAKKEYRELVHFPAYAVTCVNGLVKSVVPAGSDQFLWSLGYTKVHIPGTGVNQYSIAERYLKDSRINRPGPDFIRSTDGKSVDIIFGVASRIAKKERVGNYALTGYDAPFIWSNFRERLSCNESKATTFAYNAFPTTDIYVNNREVSSDSQGGNFAQFIKQGGKVLNSEGYGSLAGPCHTKSFGNTPSWSPNDLCLSATGGGFNGFGGGDFGGGGASVSW
jgi:uncharacterized membrane protein YgcG